MLPDSQDIMVVSYCEKPNNLVKIYELQLDGVVTLGPIKVCHRRAQDGYSCVFRFSGATNFIKAPLSSFSSKLNYAAS